MSIGLGIGMSKRALSRGKVGLRGRIISVDGHRSLSDKQSAGLMVTYASKVSILLSREELYKYCYGMVFADKTTRR